MKHIISTVKVLIFVGLFSLLATSCEDILSTQTNRYMLADDNQINIANDSVYSVIGILQKVQKLSDKYVLMGELRADLLDVSDKSDISLRELNGFTVDPAKSQFSDTKDFYAVINNCNYFIAHANENIKDKNGNYTFVIEKAAVKAIRAWTYMQLVLNYGKAYYTEEPILTIDQSLKSYPEFTQIQMLDTLISQIKPLITLNSNVNYTIPGFAKGSKYMFINPLYLLGDLHLWRASLNHSQTDYENAATYYAYLMRKESYANTDTYTTYWNDEYFKSNIDNWSQMFATVSSPEIISAIALAATSSLGTTTVMPSLSLERLVVPAKKLDEMYAAQSYYYKKDQIATVPGKFYTGDLRGKATYNTLLFTEEQTITEVKYINKFRNDYIVLYRVAQLYLRYAEAVNRAGKPMLAFAVLKYGLNNANLAAAKGYVPAKEIADNKEYVNILRDGLQFVNNVGIHNRGCGNSEFNTAYVIPDAITLPTRNDTINYVENAICDELALETAFEGNRFHDLMRLSNHRSDPKYLAGKVATKHIDFNYYFTMLQDTKNWYVPMR